MIAGLTAWIITYAVHSTLLLGGAAIASRLWIRGTLARDAMWKAALVGGILTASLQVGFGLAPAIGTVNLAAGDGAPAVMSAPPSYSTPPVVSAEPMAMVELSPRLDVAGELTAASQESGFAWPLAGIISWLAITGLGLALLALGWRRLHLMLFDRRPALAGPICAAFHRVAVDGDFARVRLSVSRSLPVPIAFGIFRKEVCVPARVAGLSPAALDALLAHELAHIARRDPAWRVIQTVIARVLFFQPLNWVANRQLERLAEHAADDWAASRTGRPLALAACLAEVAGWLPSSPTKRLLAPAMAQGPSGLRRRVERLVDFGGRVTERRPRMMWLALVVSLCVVAVAAPGASAAPEPERKDAKAPARPAAPERHAAPPPAPVGPPAAPESRLLEPRERREVRRDDERRDRERDRDRRRWRRDAEQRWQWHQRDQNDGAFDEEMDRERMREMYREWSTPDRFRSWPDDRLRDEAREQMRSNRRRQRAWQWRWSWPDGPGPRALPDRARIRARVQRELRRSLPNRAEIERQVERALRNVPSETEIRRQVERALRDLPDEAELRRDIDRALRNLPDEAELREQVERALREIPTREQMRRIIEDAMREQSLSCDPRDPLCGL